MVIGVTGSFGSGKSTVSKMFKRLGSYVIDADEIYHLLIHSAASKPRPLGRGKNTPLSVSILSKPRALARGASNGLISPSREAYRDIVRYFGEAILKKNGEIDRKKLAGIIFKDRSKQLLLNSLVHPYVLREILRLVRLHNGEKVVIVDAALLIESGLYKKMDLLVLVKTKRAIQIKRVMQSKGLKKKDVTMRIRMQAPLKVKMTLCDFIIDNSHSKTKTYTQVKKIWKQLGVNYGSE